MAASGGVRAAAVLGLLLGVPHGARADIFVHRDADGVVHLTNVPAESMAQRVLREGRGSARPVPGVVLPRVAPGRIGTVRQARDSHLYDDMITDACDRFGVEFELAKAVVRAESAFDPFAVSRKGALGLMQLMPETARMQGVVDPFRPDANIEGGVRHLRQLLDRYRDNLVLAVAAYNAGGGRVDAAGGVPDIAETKEYVRRVLEYRSEYRQGRSSAVAGR